LNSAQTPCFWPNRPAPPWAMPFDWPNHHSPTQWPFGSLEAHIPSSSFDPAGPSTAATNMCRRTTRRTTAHLPVHSEGTKLVVPVPFPSLTRWTHPLLLPVMVAMKAHPLPPPPPHLPRPPPSSSNHIKGSLHRQEQFTSHYSLSLSHP
jgi:hypothetical protein